MERSSDVSTSSKTNCRSHRGHSKTSGNIALDCSGIHVLTLALGARSIDALSSCAAPLAHTLILLGGRSTVGQRALDPRIGVRIPASQPRFNLIPDIRSTRESFRQ